MKLYKPKRSNLKITLNLFWGILIVLTLSFASCGSENIILTSKNVKSADLTKDNTNYIITQPIDLNGGTLSFPIGSTIFFEGIGCISNGTIVGNKTLLKHPKLRRVYFKGCFLNTDITLSDTFDGETDFWGLIQAFPMAEIRLARNVTLSDCKFGSIIAPRFHLNGQGHIATVHRCPVFEEADIKITNTIFDCRSAVERVIYGISKTADKKFILTNCIFQNVPEVNTICSKAYKSVRIEDCEINGLMTAQSKSSIKNIMQIRIHSCTRMVVVRKNTIKNCYGTAIAGTNFNPNDSTHVLFEDNTIDNVSGGGIIFVSGAVRNAIVRRNHINRTHALGQQFEGEINGGPNSAINFHGFHNALVENNVIENCPNSSSFDFDGSIKGNSNIAKGTKIRIRGNRIKDSGPIALYVVEDVDFINNRIDGNVCYESSNAAIMVRGARNVKISGNTLKYSSMIYPIFVTDHKNVASGKVLIENNKISTTGDIFIYVHKNYTGECQIKKNIVIYSRKKDGTIDVINKSKTIVKVPSTGNIILKK